MNHEACILQSYLDTNKKFTIGVSHLITAFEESTYKNKQLTQ